MPPIPESDRVSPRSLRGLVANQRVAFVLVGAVNTAIGLIWFVVLHRLFGDTIGYMGALVLAYALAILCAFHLHRAYVFKVRGNVLVDLVRFTMVNLGSLAINAVLLPVAVEVVGLPVLVAQLVVTVVTVCVSYVAHRSFSFRRRPSATAHPAGSRAASG